jgi:hypothetical protein
MTLFQTVAAVTVLAVPAAWSQLPPSFLKPTQPPIPTPAVPGAPADPAAAVSTVEAMPSLAPNTLSAEEVAQGWKLLFDGARLVGLRGVQKSDPLSSGWRVEGGALNLPKDIKDMDRQTGGDLITTDVFWDFDFRFEWRTTASADSGVRYMLTESSGQTPIGLEYQIIDDVHNTVGLKGGPIRRSGAVDGILPPGPNARLRTADPLLKQADPWNEGRIVVQGTRVEHWMNGEKIIEYALGPHLRRLAEENKVKTSSFFGMKGKTRICLLDQGTEIAFRNLKVRPLLPQAATVPGTAAPAVKVPNPFLLPGSGSTAPRR